MGVMADRFRMIASQPHCVTVTWNQLAPAMEAGNWEPYNNSRISVSFSGGVATVTNIQGGASDGQMMWNTPGFRRVAGEKIYVGIMMRPTWNTQFVAELTGPSDRDYPATATANTWARYGKIAIDTSSDNNDCRLCIPELSWSSPASAGDSEQIKCPIIINLTQMFGAGNEPTASEFERQCAQNGVDLTQPIPYNTGTSRSWRID